MHGATVTCPHCRQAVRLPLPAAPQPAHLGQAKTPAHKPDAPPAKRAAGPAKPAPSPASAAPPRQASQAPATTPPRQERVYRGKDVTKDIYAEAGKHLADDEQILAIAGGAGPTSKLVARDFIIVTTQRVIIWDRGVFVPSVEAFQLSDIKTVQMTDGVLLAAVAFNVFGKDEHFQRMSRADATHISELIRRKAKGAKRPATADDAHAAAGAADPVAQLERLAGLLDKGLLTREEFEQQKRKLLH